MANKVLALLMVVAVAGVALGSLWLMAPGDADASGHSATRSFSATSVDPGETVTVTIVARDYGRLGRIVETVPDGFTTSDGGQTERIRLLSAGPQTVTYTVTASDSPGSYTFSGTLADEGREERSIVGADTVTITATPSTPAPTATPDMEPTSATRSFSATSVDPGEELTVTIQANNYGGLGRVVETLPSGFTSPDASGQTVTIRLLSAGPQTETYTVTASDNPGSYTFSGVLESEDKSKTQVDGPRTVTVNAPPPTPEPRATRSFSATSVDPGEELTVTIQANNYGGLGRVVETLPSGFTSPDASGQTVTLRLLQEGPQTRSYTVTASDNPGPYNFSGVLESEDKSETPVLGPTTVTVNAPPGPSARRSFSTTSVDPGGTVTVTIRANNYGGLGRVVETLPSGFTTPPSPDASGQTVTLRLLQAGPQTRSYTVTAPDNPGSYNFSGVLESEDRSETPVRGPSTVTVAAEVTPPANRAPAFASATATRSVDENSAPGANVGDPVRVTDADRDRLTYALGGTDSSSFTISSSNTGQIQIMVGTDTMLDFEDKDSYMVMVEVRDNKDGDGNSVTMEPYDDVITVTINVTNVEEKGTVTLDSEQPIVGTAIAAALEDPDGGITGMTWQWASSDAMDGDFTVISGATAAAYTPADADVGNYLQATASYDDAEGSGRMEMAVTVNAVTAEEVFNAYDLNQDGQIDRDEYLRAITAYFEPGSNVSKAEVETVIDLYLGF